MTDTEKQYFDKLTKKREGFADQLDDPDYQGVKKTVVDKYSDQAHFIYELLQNADDAKAVKARIILKPDGIYFCHNGTIPFSISDPEIKETDKMKIGHINAITSIGNSNKEERSNSIGKFGVGFKSVFQYTDTPHIYSTAFQFKIERFIVPKLLSIDIQRDETDTVFYFPFDKDGMKPPRAYTEILEKLKSLIYPTVFLSHLKEVEWIAENESGIYLMETKAREEYTNIECNLIEILNEVNEKIENEKLLLFKKKIAESNQEIAVGFFLDGKNCLRPVDYPAFCFFPTKESTKLKFIVHAPFLLTDSREGIKAGEDWNILLIEELSNLTAESLLVLKNKNLIDDNILAILPYRISDFMEIGNKNSISFKPFYNTIMEKLKKESLLPARNGQYTDKSHAYWADAEELANLFSDMQLARLVDDPDAKFVFTSIGRTKDSDITQYIDGGDDRSWIKKEPNLIAENLTPEKMLKKITSGFIEGQNWEWLYRLYEYLLERESYRSYVKNKPIFIESNKKAVSAFDSENQLILFLPSSEETEYNTIHKDFVKNDTARKFFETFGITKPNLKDEIYNIIIPKYRRSAVMNIGADFKKFFYYYKDCPGSQRSEYLELLKKIDFLQFKSAERSFVCTGNAETIYFPSPEMKSYFELDDQARFLDIDFYRDLIEKSDHELLENFLIDLGVSKYPRVEETYVSARQVGFSYDAKYLYDKSIVGCANLLKNINKNRSITLWKILLLMIQKEGNVNFLRGQHRAGIRETFESSELKRLKNESWIVDKDGTFFPPDKITIDAASDEYDKTGDSAEILINILGFRVSVFHYLSDKEKNWMDIGRKFDGCSNEEIEEMLQRIRKGEPIKDSKNPEFPKDNNNDHEGRIDVMVEKYQNAEEKAYETRPRRVRVSSISSGDKKTYLENHYTNDEGRMVCQICEKEMPFKKKDGGYYYESVELLNNFFSRESAEKYIALCPECSARYNEFVLHDETVMKEIKNNMLNETELVLELGNKTREDGEQFKKSIRFVSKHFIDLQTILRQEQDG